MKRKEALLSSSALDTSFVSGNLTGWTAKLDSYAGASGAKVNICDTRTILFTYIKNKRQDAQYKQQNPLRSCQESISTASSCR